MLPSIDEWRDERPSATIRLPKGDDDSPHPYRHAPDSISAPANDNRRAWIEFDAAGKAIRVVRAARGNPLLCTPHKAPAAPPQVAPHPVDERILERNLWRHGAPANDGDIFGRKPRNKGAHPDFEKYLPELRFWRFMSSPHGEWDDALPANDNGAPPTTPDDENTERRPSDGELLRCLPAAVLDGMQRARLDGMKTLPPRALLTLSENDIEWHRGRIARLGGLKFSTAISDRPDDGPIVGDPVVSNVEASVPLSQSNEAGTVPRAGTLLEYRPLGSMGWRRTSDQGRERRAGADVSKAAGNSWFRLCLDFPMVATYRPRLTRRRDPIDPNLPLVGELPEIQHFPPGLPWRPASLSSIFGGMVVSAKAGKSDGDGNFERVRGMRYTEYDAIERLGDAGTVDVFRTYHPDHALVLDVAMAADNMSELARALGRASAHTGKRVLERACLALRDFRMREAA